MVAPRKQPPLLALVEELLAEQGRLQTPVARASIAHDQIANRKSEIVNFQSLIPLTAPAPGEQYSFEVDLDACSGCKACVAGCHSLNGLDHEEAWRDTGLLIGGDHRHPFQQTVTTACHHCADPACLHGCPVLAYEKDPLTGIVRHLDDQCIGCSYCILKCPYDVPKYSSRLGIVRKCDMCHQRLAAGEAPACVQACPTHAIRIVTMRLSGPFEAPPLSAAPPGSATEARAGQDSCAIPPPAGRASDTQPFSPSVLQPFLPGAPDPSYTRPTTRYLTTRVVPAGVRPADQNTLRPQPAHWPLVIMLVCTQAALGLQVADLCSGPAAGNVTYHVTFPARPLGWAAAGLAAIGLAASVAHLGRPLRAWRVFLGLRRSWLSREAVLFGAWLPALVLSLGTDLPPAPLTALALGFIGVYCSVMIYVDTRRHAWRLGQTLPRFFGTALVAGLAGSAVLSPGVTSLVTLALALGGKLLIEASTARPAAEHDADTGLFPALATARLLTGRFRPALGLRVVAATAGLLALLALGDRPAGHVTYYVTSATALALLLAGELAERYLYFRTVDAPKMPGHAGRELP